MDDAHLLSQQIEYYRARAPEYDEWFLREGRYDRGHEHRAEWVAEIARVEALLGEMHPPGDVLELACGTGLWTRHLTKANRRVVAVDASAEAIALNRDRVKADNVEYIEADLFSWEPPRSSFDSVFFAFWLSHVPAGRFDTFWASVRSSLRPNGRVFFIDGLREPTSTARDHDPLTDTGVVRRRLNDGREFDVVKVFYEPAALERRLLSRGWNGSVRSTGKFFLYGSVTAEGSPSSVPATDKVEGTP